MGLVTGDSNTEHSAGGYPSATVPVYEEDDYDGNSDSFDDDVIPYEDDKMARYGRGITESSPARGTRAGRAGSSSSGGSIGNEKSGMSAAELREYETQRRRWHESRSRSGSRDQAPPTPPPKPPVHGGTGTPGNRGSGGSFVSPRGGTGRGPYL